MNKQHLFEIRIYYEDTDFSGYVYHANYLKFMERARTELLREIDVHHFELAKQGIVFAVRHMDIYFEKPAFIDDLLIVTTNFISAKGARLLLKQTILKNDITLVRAKVEVVAISKSGKPIRLPKEIIEKLSA